MKRKHKEEEENQERWLLTYADMITLLVAFFMMMYSMSVINLEKFRKAAIGIRSGFNGPALDSKNNGDTLLEKSERQAVVAKVEAFVPPREIARGPEMLRPQPVRALPHAIPKSAAPAKQVKKKPGKPVVTRADRVADLVKKINQSLGAIQPGKTVKVIGETRGVAIELIGEPIFFPKDTAQLSAEAKRLLNSLAKILSSLPNEISVEGHASWFEAPQGAPFSNSWELSTARGTTVVEYLLRSGNINPKLVSVTGYGHYRPESERHKDNDRVRIFVYQE